MLERHLTMSPVNSSQAIAREPALAPGWHDITLTELPEHLRSDMEPLSTSWFNSLPFSMEYADPAAVRLAYWVAADRQLVCAIPYYERRWLGCWRMLHLFGPASLPLACCHDLLVQRGADLAVIHRQDEVTARTFCAGQPGVACQRVSEDFVITLPATVEQYLASLGARTRKLTLQHQRRLEREWGEELHVRIVENEAITREMCTEVVELNRARRAVRGARHLWTPELLDRRWRLAQQQGVFCGVYHGETLAGGTVSFFYRGQAYTGMLGHDRAYDRLNVGKLALWLTIKHFIHCGIRRHHLLWGNSPYKTRFGAHEETLYDVALFRSPVAGWLWRLGGLLCRLCSNGKLLFCRALGPQLEKVVRRIFGACAPVVKE